MAQVKVRYSGAKQIVFCDAANGKNLLFSKQDIKRNRREQMIDDGPWVQGWLAASPDLSIVVDPVLQPEVKKEPEKPKPEPVKQYQYAQRKPGPKGK